VSTLQVSVSAGESGPVIVLSGEADFQGTAELSTVLTAQLAAGVLQLLVNVSELRFADSTSVRALVLAARTLRDRGGALVLIRPQPSVARVLEIMGADQLLTVQSV
jgi:anti-sigma B factor antagonist